MTVCHHRAFTRQTSHKNEQKHLGELMDIAQLLAFSVKNGASDLHLSAGLPPMIRVDGDVRRINIDLMEHEFIATI